MSVLQDQECAGALMWTCVTVVYLLPAAILTMRLLGARNTFATEIARPELRCIKAPDTEPQEVEVA